MQSSSHKMNTPVADSVHMNIYLKKKTFAYAEIDASQG